MLTTTKEEKTKMINNNEIIRILSFFPRISTSKEQQSSESVSEWVCGALRQQAQSFRQN